MLTSIDEEVARAAGISARERDLDNFLIEELQASVQFCEWFLTHLRNCLDVSGYATAKIGKNPKREVTGGQTDLSFVLSDSAGMEIVHVLIEDKVTRGFEPDQPERYAQEVEAARERLGQRRAAAVLVAPSANTAVLDNPCFDVSIRLEEIVDHLRGRRDRLARASDPLSAELAARLAARIDLLNALIQKRNYNGDWTPNPVPERLDFNAQYRELASRLAPRFKLRPSSGGPKDKTRRFEVPTIPGLPITEIRHNCRSDVALVLSNAAGAKPKLDRSGLLPANAETDANVKSGTLLIRLKTEPLDPTGDRFLEQAEAVEAGIRAAIQLHDWARDNAVKLREVIAGS
jgi:hypothetical protein